MNLQPDYMENIIVGVLLNDKFSWYVSDKDLWFLDYSKMIQSFEKKGFEIDVENIDDKRKGMIILDTENAAEFLKRIEINKVTSSELHSALLANRTQLDDTWQYDYRPSLYINFDKKNFYSSYSEPASFEDYMPNLWVAEYQSFDNLIPREQRYWLDSNHKNLLY